MEIIRLANDNQIDIKTIPTEQADLPSEVYDTLQNNEKIIGGIFNNRSIKFIRDDIPKISFIPDTSKYINYDYQVQKEETGGKNGGGDGGMSDLERRVQNLEFETQKIREQLSEIKYQNNAISSKLDNSVTKSDFLQFQNQISSSLSEAISKLPSISEIKNATREIIKEDNIASINDVKLIVSDEMKIVPSINDIKDIINEAITDKKLVSETKVENIVMKQKNSTIKWVIGTGIAIIAATAGVLKLFIH